MSFEGVESYAREVAARERELDRVVREYRRKAENWERHEQRVQQAVLIARQAGYILIRENEDISMVTNEPGFMAFLSWAIETGLVRCPKCGAGDEG